MPGTYPTAHCRHQHQERAKENNQNRVIHYFDDFNVMINKMTNWQRSQWAKNGYPGLKDKEEELAEPYTMLKR